MNKLYQSEFPLKNLLIPTLFLIVFTAGCYSLSQDATSIPLDASSAPSATPQIEPTETIPSPTQENGESSPGEWTDYYNETLQFSFSYPTAWYGPDVYETEGSLRQVVGSDVVYPYGTDRTEQVTTIPDSYYITIQYFKNTQGRTWDDFIASGWITTYLELFDLADGESVTTPRSLTIRVREISLGNFQGLEYIATLSDTAETERVYIREIMVFDEELNWLRVTGSPNLVEVTDPENWKDDFRRVDLSNLEIFTRLVESIIIE